MALMTYYQQGNLSVATSRLLKAILPASCLWTSLRESEGHNYSQTLKKLNELYPPEDDDMDGERGVLNDTVPQSIRDMVGCKHATEALGAMIWYATARIYRRHIFNRLAGTYDNSTSIKTY